MRKLKVGLAGLGVMGKHHLRILSQLDGVDLVGGEDALAAASGEYTAGAPSRRRRVRIGYPARS